jgi:broad specificity phosphatase PhoE
VIARALAVGGTGDGGKVALFAHAHILRILAARWVGLEARGGSLFSLGTGSVSVLGWERETRVIQRWNRTFEDES